MADGKRPLSPADKLKEAVWRQIVQLARVDSTFRERLLADPVAVLAAAELNAPADISFVFVEANGDGIEEVAARSNGSVIFVPINPAEEHELSDEALSGVAGGSGGRIDYLLDIPAMPPSFARSISLSDGGGDLARSGQRRKH